MVIEAQPSLAPRYVFRGDGQAACPQRVQLTYKVEDGTGNGRVGVRPIIPGTVLELVARKEYPGIMLVGYDNPWI